MLFIQRMSKTINTHFVKSVTKSHSMLFLLQDGFAPPEEVDGDVPPLPNEEEEY